MPAKQSFPKVSLVLTNKVQVRSWLSKKSLYALARQFDLSIYAPEVARSEVEACQSKIAGIYYYEIPKRKDLEYNLFAFLITTHLRWPSFRRRFKYEFLNQAVFENIFFSIRNFIRSIKTNSTLVWFCLSPLRRNAILRRTRKELRSLSFTIAPCDIVIVVSNHSDLVNEIAINAANECGASLIQIVENWDNISSKLCPSGDARKLIVWGQQTKDFAIEMHNFSQDKVVALGSSRIPNRMEIRALKSTHRGSLLEDGTLKVFYPGYGGENETMEFMGILHREILQEFPNLIIKIIFRPHPLSVKARGENYYSKWPNYIEIDLPNVEYQRGSDWPKLDHAVYSKMLQSDLVIGTPSTFLLEAMLFDLPVILDLRKSYPKFHSHRDRFFSASHFKMIIDDNRIPRFMNDAEVGKVIRRAILGLEDYSSLRDTLVYNDEVDFVERVVNILKEENTVLNSTDNRT